MPLPPIARSCLTALLACASASAAVPTTGTDADYVAFKSPDGDITQDFTYAGLPDGLPATGAWPVFDIAAYGAVAGDGKDDRAAIQKAIDAAQAGGKGVILVPAGTFDLVAMGDSYVLKVTAGNIVFRGASRTDSRLRLIAGRSLPSSAASATAIIDFLGAKKSVPGGGTDRFLLADAPAGATSIRLGGSAIAKGDVLRYEGPFQNWIFQARSVSGDQVTLEQPLRMGIRKNEGKARNYGVIQNLGVEHLTLEQSFGAAGTDLFNGINFTACYRGWIDDVTIRTAGRHPVDFNAARYIRITDCIYDRVRNRGGDAQGYAGFWGAADCLMDGVTAYSMRHGPNLQSGAIGCVIRNSRFYQSDMQWHAGMPSCNLMEGVYVENDPAKPGFRVAQALKTPRTGVDGAVHAPAWSWNVVWGCDLLNPGTGATGGQFGGFHNNWLFAYNRMVIAGGDNKAMLQIWMDRGRDFTIRGNIFATRNDQGKGGFELRLASADANPPDYPLVNPELGTDPADSLLRFIGNRFYGYPLVGGRWWTAAYDVSRVPGSTYIPTVDQGNVHSATLPNGSRLSLADFPITRTVPSLYAWQMQRKYGPPPTNQKPTVSAGPDRAAVLPGPVALDGTVADDGLPAGAVLGQTWSKVSGPGTVTFATGVAVDTMATFSAAGTYVLRLTASDTAASASDDVVVTISGAASGGLPSGWVAVDVGQVGAAGSTVVSGGTWTMKGSGADIWGSSDEFQGAFTPFTGDGVVTVRVASLQNTNAWAKAGIMLRSSTAASAAHAFACVTAGNGTAFQRRAVAGGPSAHISGSVSGAPRWLRIERSGDVFIVSESADGASWLGIGSQTIVMPVSIQAGIVLTSHADGTLGTAVFTDLSVLSAAPNNG